ncbi:hypothetical protein CR205_03310 [Alteribacter lacisalsi]|uniref:Uncharacterized protein n=1 Tax=Alteribacter lacisalsi TaxID=2045244 RepID=A0A2W0HA30_9BACI|nr:hypothetical protein [Alteribacter lacisalsi]PYZ97636.1 hypothetical protein CR205_03310 [Alteribacter lacisalsi]
MSTNLKGILLTAAAIFVLSVIVLLLPHHSNKEIQSISMAGFIVEEKHHHVESGEYIEMWIVGSNIHEKPENRVAYKIMIEEAMVYNLIEEGEVYMISATTVGDDGEFGDVFELLQIANQETYQLSGRGKIK